MTSREAVATTLRALNDARVPHLRTGGLAANVYGFARATKDADIVIEMALPSFEDFAQRLPAEIQLDPQVSFETITDSHRHIIALKRSSSPIELFCWAITRTTGTAFAADLNATYRNWTSSHGLPPPRTWSFKKSAGIATRTATTRATFSPCRARRSISPTSTLVR